MMIGYDGIVIAASKKNQADGADHQGCVAGAGQGSSGARHRQSGEKPVQDLEGRQPRDLPAKKIEVLGPPPTSGTRDAFVELVMDHGCKEFGASQGRWKSRREEIQGGLPAIREDGAYIEAGENDNLIVQKLVANPMRWASSAIASWKKISTRFRAKASTA
jgi:phosphate transport system substrate-binding protein